MSITLKVAKADGNETIVGIDSLPSVCPQCRHGIQAIFLTSHLFAEAKRLQLACRCPIETCQKLFIATYTEGYSNWSIDSLAPLSPIAPAVNPAIKSISPDFMAIYAEAHDAEQRGSTKIAGAGYRKALEFLVKDYLISQRPEDADTIKRVQLGACIENYVDDGRIKAVAKRAAWLGNDETHYVRLWEGKNLAHLVRLIDLTMNWIMMEVETAAALADMPEAVRG